MEQDSFDQAEFADNPEPRCPVALVLDTSGSMHGAPIVELNEGLRAFGEAIRNDNLPALRVEVAVITFGGKVRAINVKSDEVSASTQIAPFNPRGLALRPAPQEVPFDAHLAFVTADRFQPPVLDAKGGTPMGEAVQRAL